MKKLIIVIFALLSLKGLFADDLSTVVVNSGFGLNNGAIELIVSGGFSPYTYSWSGPDGFTSTEQNLSGLAPGEYCVTVSDNFCGVATICATVDEDQVSEISALYIVDCTILPNPFTDHFAVNFTTAEQADLNLILTDLAGRTIYENRYSVGTGDQNIEVRLPIAIAPGTYRLAINRGNEKLIEAQLVHIE